MSSTKNTFRKVHCLDHVVGVLRYLACNDGQIKTKRNGDGIISYPHTHYARQPISDYHRHARGIDMLVVEPLRKYVVRYLD